MAGKPPAIPVAEVPRMNPGDEAEPGTPQTGEAVCPACAGTGRRDGRACAACGGAGTIVQIVGDA